MKRLNDSNSLNSNEVSEEKLSRQVTVRFTESQYKRLEKIASDKQRKEADLIRFLTVMGMEQIDKL